MCSCVHKEACVELTPCTMESKRELETPYVDDIDCVSWLEEVDMVQYAQVFMANFTLGGTGFLSRKRLGQVRLQDFPYMNILNYDHQKILMQHIRHTLKYTYQSPVRIRETQQTSYGKLRQKRLEEEQERQEKEEADRKARVSSNNSRRPSNELVRAGSQERLTAQESTEISVADSKEAKAKGKKKNKTRRHTFDEKAWEAINKSRKGDTDHKAASEALRDVVAPSVTDAEAVAPPKRKQKLHRRRSTFNDSDDVANVTDKASAYGNLVQDFNSWQSELAKVQEQQLTQFNSLVGCETSTILFLNDRTRELACSQNGKWVSYTVDSGLTAQCCERGELINVTEEPEKDPRFNKTIDKTPTGVSKIESVMFVPIKALKSGGKVVGVLVMVNKKKNGQFDKNDENVITVCAERMADDIYDVFKELLNLNDNITLLGSSFFPPAVDPSKSKSRRFLESTANSRSGMMSFSKQNSMPLTDDSIESMRQRYLSFEVGTHSFAPTTK